ncbi:OLC1v1034084C1 [Oldenlandia corymbosa var. corymbosa]|uniref:OLC1v1034084C1 n=1 Tax=Oldenlandia corymbosa var. corymbosa TaxID=529605 RepID=A0AAV1CR38_OLDCO|nr:OLC1v1034084C1 [Oldenlandia corymbosa var. corymbosa]
MTEKVCSHHKGKQKRFFQRLCAILLVVAFILLLIFLITWAILQPKKPRFILQDATIFNLTVPAPNILTTNLQVTIYSRNPNSKVGIYYDHLHVYATYHSQQITYYTQIPSVYQGHKDVNIWSPFIYGTMVPIAPYNGLALTQAQSNGGVDLKIRLDGRVKWKVGAVTTGRYHIHVTCQAYIPFGNRGTGIVIGTGVKYQLSQSCSVSL